MLPDVEQLDRQQAHFGLHPAGFAYLQLEPQKRLHVWDDSLPKQEGNSGIHDHIFDMHSEVLLGKMLQVRYRFELEHHNQPTHEIYIVKHPKTASSALTATKILGILEIERVEEVAAGSSYQQPAFTFHGSQPEGYTLTIIERTQVYPGTARVLIPIAETPDTNYKRVNEDDDLAWATITQGLALLS